MQGVWSTSPRNEHALQTLFEEYSQVRFLFSQNQSRAFQGVCTVNSRVSFPDLQCGTSLSFFSQLPINFFLLPSAVPLVRFLLSWSSQLSNKYPQTSSSVPLSFFFSRGQSALKFSRPTSAVPRLGARSVCCLYPCVSFANHTSTRPNHAQSYPASTSPRNRVDECTHF